MTRALGFTQPGSSTATLVNTGAAAAGAGASGAAAAGLITAGAASGIGAGIALAAILISALIANSGCGPTCVLATGIVDQLEPQLRANRDAYLNGPRTARNQAAALSVFDNAFGWLRSAVACGAPELGDAGKRCISDRDPGGKTDWYSYYRDPIAAAAPTESAPLEQLAHLDQGSNAWLLAAGIAIVIGLSL